MLAWPLGHAYLGHRGEPRLGREQRDAHQKVHTGSAEDRDYIPRRDKSTVLSKEGWRGAQAGVGRALEGDGHWLEGFRSGSEAGCGGWEGRPRSHRVSRSHKCTDGVAGGHRREDLVSRRPRSVVQAPAASSRDGLLMRSLHSGPSPPSQ